MTKTLLLTLAATAAAECGYMVLCALFPAFTFGQALMLTTGLHLLAHWAIARHMTLTSAAETATIVLIVDLVVHAFELHGAARVVLHLGVVIAIGLYRYWRNCQ